MIELNEETKDMIDSGKWAMADSMDSFECFIYFVTYEDGPIKIGKAKNVTKRLKTLQTSHSQKLEVMGVIPARAMLEGAIHVKFKSLRVTGEWFKRSPELLDYIKRFSRLYSSDLQIEAETVLFKRKRDEITPVDRGQISTVDFLKIYAHLRKNLVNGFNFHLQRRHTDFLFQMVIACRSFLKLIEEIDQSLRAEGRALVNQEMIIKEFRRAVDDIFEVPWQESKFLLSSEEIDRGRIELLSNAILRRNIASWLGDHDSAYHFCAKLAGFDENEEQQEVD